MFIFLLCSCSSKKLNPELEEYLDKISFSKAYNYVLNGTSNSIYEEYDSNENLIGKSLVSLFFSKSSDDDNYYIKTEYNFFGNKIKDSITYKEDILFFDESREIYYYEETVNNSEKCKNEISNVDAYSCMKKIFYSYDTTYKGGGLYYGDFFMVGANNYSYYYKINEDNSLTVKTESETYYEGATLYQTLTIDNYGMLLNCNQKMDINDNNAYATLLINAEYNN